MEKILLVDDEQSVLDAFHRQLRKQFNIETAVSGREGLKKIADIGPFAVIVSDMRMPVMDGIAFLVEARKVSPESVRMMLTGNADQQTAIDAINHGSIFRFITKPCSPTNLAEAIDAGLEQYRLTTEVARQALQDPLTGLANRRQLIEHYAREVSRAKRNGKPLSLLMLDLDHFKSINDRYGHLAGDACLKSITATIKSSLRNIDITARFGGEEFIVLLPETGESGARIVAEKLRSAVAETEIQLHSEIIHVTVSIGIVTAESLELDNFDEIVGRADTAMYSAKGLGRNMVCASMAGA